MPTLKTLNEIQGASRLPNISMCEEGGTPSSTWTAAPVLRILLDLTLCMATSDSSFLSFVTNWGGILWQDLALQPGPKEAWVTWRPDST